MDDSLIRKRFANDISLALGLPRTPAMLTERELAEAKIRSADSLQEDRRKGVGIKYTKLKGSIKYPLHFVLDFLVCNQRNHTNDGGRRDAVMENLQKAHEQRHAKAAHDDY